MKMQTSAYLTVDDVAQMLDISIPYAYAIIQKWNKELDDKGYLVIKGRIPSKYFYEKVYVDERGCVGECS